MNKSVAERLKDHTAIDKAIQDAAEDARLLCLRLNMKAPTWRNGKIVYVSPRRRSNGRKTPK